MKSGIIILLLVYAGLFKGQKDLVSLYKKYLPAVVRITVQKNNLAGLNGTGFFIDSKRVITCYHVIENFNFTMIKAGNGKEFTADSVIACNRQKDIVIFTVKEKSDAWLKLSEKKPEPGEEVFIIGNPEGCDFSISNGIVSAVRIKDSVQVVQTTAPASQGSSGSPLFDKNGEVTGMMSYVKYAVQNINFAVTSSEMIHLKSDHSLKRLRTRPQTMRTGEIDSLYQKAMLALNSGNYQSAIHIFNSFIQYASKEQLGKCIEPLGRSHFLNQEHGTALPYLEAYIANMSAVKSPGAENLLYLAQALQMKSLCLFTMGDVEGAVISVSKSIELSRVQLNADIQRKEAYKLLLRNMYFSLATYKLSQDKKDEACMSWKIAKEYGYKGDELQLDNLCR